MKENVPVEESLIPQETPAEILPGEEKEEVVAPTSAEVEEAAPKKEKKNLRWLINYIKTHENLRQMVLFTLFSLCCAVAQTVTQFALKYAIGAFHKQGFVWFLFSYPQEKGMAEFVGFLVGSVVGQVMTFVLNRKTTFRATNNVVIAGSLYAVMAVAIILLQTYLGGVVTAACNKALVAAGNENAFLDFLATVAGMMVGGFAAWILSFVCNKYLIMRDWGKKKKSKEVEEDPQE